MTPVAYEINIDLIHGRSPLPEAPEIITAVQAMLT